MPQQQHTFKWLEKSNRVTLRPPLDIWYFRTTSKGSSITSVQPSSHPWAVCTPMLLQQGVLKTESSQNSQYFIKTPIQNFLPLQQILSIALNITLLKCSLCFFYRTNLKNINDDFCALVSQEIGFLHWSTQAVLLHLIICSLNTF